MNKRQLDLIMSIARDVIEDYLNMELAYEAAGEIRQGIVDSMDSFEALGTGKEPEKQSGKMDDGCLIELKQIAALLQREFGK